MQLAAELGRALLQENKLLQSQLDELRTQKNAELEEWRQKTDLLESTLLAATGQGAQSLEQFLQLQRDAVHQDQAKKYKELEFELSKLKERNIQLTSQCEIAENAKYELLEEFDKMKAEVNSFRTQWKQDKETNMLLKEMIEVQKEAINEALHIKEENKRLVGKLKAQQSKPSDTVEGITDLQTLQEDNKRLEKELHIKEKMEDKLRKLEAENDELRDLLKDKEQMADAANFLIEENKKYRKQQQEMLSLLEEANRTAYELREHIELSHLEAPMPIDEQLKRVTKKHPKIEEVETRGRSASLPLSLDQELQFQGRVEELPFMKDENLVSKLGTSPGKLKGMVPEETNPKQPISEEASVLDPAPSESTTEESQETYDKPVVKRKVSFGHIPIQEEKETASEEKVEHNESIVEVEDIPKAIPENVGLAGRQRGMSWAKAMEKTKVPKRSSVVIRGNSLVVDGKVHTEIKPASSSITKQTEGSIQSRLDEFRSKARTFAIEKPKLKSEKPQMKLEEKFQLLEILGDKLKSAESTMGDMQANLDGRQDKQDLLQELNRKLMLAEKSLRGKDATINQLERQLANAVVNLKEGWLNKKGNYLPIWRRRWFSLSGIDNRIYYSADQSDRFSAIVKADEGMKETGKPFGFIVNCVESDFRVNYYLQAENEAEMYSWIEAIQERIERYYSKGGALLMRRSVIA